MSTLVRLVAGRRTKWVVVALWIVAVVVMMPLGSKLADETRDDTASFLPESAESTRVVELLDSRFASKETSQGLIVYQRDGGLTEADKAKIAEDARQLAALPHDQLPLEAPPMQPFAKERAARASSPQDGSLAYTVLVLSRPTSRTRPTGASSSARPPAPEADGMQIKLTGDLGFNTDACEVFSDIDTKLLLATVLLVLVLLGAIYRSVLVALTPLIVVFFAYTVAQGFIYLLAKSGATVSSNSTSILIVLMFGVGTDYCLLLVSRLREELRRTEDKHDAMAQALSRSGPAILASGLTVAAGDAGARLRRLAQHLDPRPGGGDRRRQRRCSPGSRCCPPLLTIFGRRGFWPRRRDGRLRPRARGRAEAGCVAAVRRPGPPRARGRRCW